MYGVVATPERLAHVRVGVSLCSPPPQHPLFPTPPALMWSDCRLPFDTSRMGAQRWHVSVTCSNGAASQGRPCLSCSKSIGRRSSLGHRVAHDLSFMCHKQCPLCLPATVRDLKKKIFRRNIILSTKGKKLSWSTAQKHVVRISQTPCTAYGVTTGRLWGIVIQQRM